MSCSPRPWAADLDPRLVREQGRRHRPSGLRARINCLFWGRRKAPPFSSSCGNHSPANWENLSRLCGNLQASPKPRPASRFRLALMGQGTNLAVPNIYLRGTSAAGSEYRST